METGNVRNRPNRALAEFRCDPCVVRAIAKFCASRIQPFQIWTSIHSFTFQKYIHCAPGGGNTDKPCCPARGRSRRNNIAKLIHGGVCSGLRFTTQVADSCCRMSKTDRFLSCWWQLRVWHCIFHATKSINGPGRRHSKIPQTE